MAVFELSSAKTVLLAVSLAGKSDITNLRALIVQHRNTLRTDLVLRILLSHLPESLDSGKYVPFLQELMDGLLEEDTDLTLEASVLTDLAELKELGEKEASKRVRKLHLLPLLWRNAPTDVPDDSFIQFLIHRSLRVDENAGLIAQLPGLLEPFLPRSSYLRTWMITTILPLLRLGYEYHPSDSPTLSIPEFEQLSDHAGIALLLSSTGKVEESATTYEVGQDLKGLVGPWMYGDNRAKRRKLRKASATGGQAVTPLHEGPILDDQYTSWEEVFKWITNQASASWKTAVQAIEQWDGPGDVDLGGYATEWLNEEQQQHLEKRYGRAALASAYLVPEASLEALSGVHRILVRTITLLDFDRIPTLEAAGALLTPVIDVENLLSSENKTFLRSNHLEESNVLTTPNEASLRLLHALLISAYIVTKAGNAMTLKRSAELALLQQEHEQRTELKNLVAVHNTRGPKGDDKYWVRMRNEILWLRNWGADELEGGDTGHAKGVLGKIHKDEIEVMILKSLLSNNRRSNPKYCDVYVLMFLPRYHARSVNLPKLSRQTIITASLTRYLDYISQGCI
jgi:hypothetical protein